MSALVKVGEKLSGYGAKHLIYTEEEGSTCSAVMEKKLLLYSRYCVTSDRYAQNWRMHISHKLAVSYATDAMENRKLPKTSNQKNKIVK